MSCKDRSGACRALSMLLGRTRGLGRCCLCSQRRGCQGGGAAGGCTKPGGEEQSELAFGTDTHSPQQQSQPLALVCCEVPRPLPGHRWAGGGEKPQPDPLAAPQPHQTRAALAPCPSPPHCHEPSLPGVFGGSGAALPFVFPFPLSVGVAGFLCSVSFLGGNTASLRAAAGEHPPARPAVLRAGRLTALPARILHSFTSFR